MKIVSIINYKGGVGKTTLTANLGVYAAMNGYRVLMIDLDPQTHLTFSFISPEEWKAKYAELKTLKNYFAPILRGADRGQSLSSLVIPLRCGNYLGLDGLKFDLISSHLELIDIDIKLAGLINVMNRDMWAATTIKAVSHLRNDLWDIRDNYDLVLIDCPPNFNMLVRNAITASDYYLIPAKLDYLSMLGIDQLTRNVKKYLKEYDEHTEILKRQHATLMPIFLTLLGVVPMMVNIQKEDRAVSVEERYKDELKEQHYRIYQYVRNNSTKA